MGILKHGLARRSGKPPEYAAWARMTQRCTVPSNPKYAAYGGRGIVVCERWRQDFAAFLADMGPRPSSQHSIDRINNDGNYEPGNCRWATAKEQSNNRRRRVDTLWLTNNAGERRPIAEWVRVTGLARNTITNRLLRGWSIDEALTRKVSNV